MILNEKQLKKISFIGKTIIYKNYILGGLKANLSHFNTEKHIFLENLFSFIQLRFFDVMLIEFLYLRMKAVELEAMKNMQGFIDLSKILLNVILPEISNFIKTIENPKSLNDEKEALEKEIDEEEQWTKRIAFQVLKSDQDVLYAVLNSLWLLSKNTYNSSPIINNQEAINSIIDTLTLDHSGIFIAPCFGILANCSQTEENIHFLLHNYTEQINQAISIAGKIIKESSEVNKQLEVTIAFCYNLSLIPEGSSILFDNFIIEAFMECLDLHESDSYLLDICYRTLLSLFSQKNINECIRLSSETLQSLYQVINSLPKTSSSIELLVRMKTVFQFLLI